MQNWFYLLIILLYILQIISLIAVIFIENKDPVSTMSWILILSFLPIIGFILYLFFGRGLTYLTSKKLKLRHHLMTEFQSILPQGSQAFKDTWNLISGQEVHFNDPNNHVYQSLLRLNFALAFAPYTQNNNAKIYVDAKEKYNDLFEDIRSAKSSIHLCYFIVSDTNISHELVALLSEKAKEGVSVRFLYDSLGNFFVNNKKIFAPLKKAGGEVHGFFPLSLGNFLHANYRNHHKIAVIDGVIGYTGGMNIGDEYMGLHQRKTPWRDTHMRMTGNSVASLQFLFLIDLYYTTGDQNILDHYFDSSCFPPPIDTGTVGMQIVPSGPDDTSEAIKRGFIKMISMAKKYIYIQTPYLIPDQTVLECIQIAARSGVDVQIMIPGIADKKTVYNVTSSYIQNMLDYGVKVFIHEGFLHAKMIVIDDKISTLGTTNLDMRSFSLHFEVNNFIFDSDISKQCGDIFRKDIESCYEMTQERHNQRSGLKRVLERVFRLFAPLM